MQMNTSKSPLNVSLKFWTVMLALCMQAIVSHEPNAASYGITVPAGKQYLAAFHFQSQTISQVFPAYSVPYGTQVFV